jgi:hypothetical protein
MDESLEKMDKMYGHADETISIATGRVTPLQNIVHIGLLLELN